MFHAVVQCEARQQRLTNSSLSQGRSQEALARAS